VRRLSHQLGDRLRGAWLTGSAALGDFVPARSDLDIQALATGHVPEPERRDLALSVSHEALPCPARGLEFVLYSEPDLHRVAGPAFQLNLNTGPRMPRHLALDPAEDPRFWFVIDVAIARRHGRRLAGEPPETLLPQLPRGLVLRALLDAIAWHRRHAGASGEAAVAAARAWAWATDGRWRSKPDAAAWARGRAPEADVAAAAVAALRTELAAAGPTRPAGAG
jgi:Domain of unknown function (DUF4111)